MTELARLPVLLGFRRDGRPIYLAQGGAEPPDFKSADDGGDDPGDDEDEGKEQPDPPADEDKDPKAGDDPKDEKGALAALRAKERRDERAKAKLKAENDALRAQLAGTGKAKEEDEPDPEAIRKEAREQARTEVLHERALDKVEVAAAKAGFAESEDARLFLAAHAEDFITGGKVDTDAINDAIEELATKRPYLLKGAKGKRFEGGADQGPRGTRPKSLDAQIAEAQKAGDHGAVIALQMQKLKPAN